MTLISRLSDAMTRIAGEFGTVRSEIEAINPRRYVIPINGRFRSYSNGRWVGFLDGQGTGSGTFQQDHGTAAEPNIDFRQNGILIPQGHTLKRVLLLAGANNNAWATSQIRLYHQTGDLASWDSNAETTRTLIAQDNNFAHPSQEIRRWAVQPNFVSPADGLFLMYVKPNAGAGNARYLSVSLCLELEFPS